MLGFFICLVAQPTSATLNNQSGVNKTKESIARAPKDRAVIQEDKIDYLTKPSEDII
jgi:hypothetical protein